MSVPTPTPLVLVTPFAADANNGNWRTAARWARLLAPAYRSLLQTPDAPVTGDGRDGAALMIALHARRSRAAIEAWTRQRPRRPLVVALTGTDLYRDVAHADADALRSLDEADALIVLQEDALATLPARVRAKAHVVFQSARSLVPFAGKSPRRLNAVLVAHLREEKDPRTVFEAWRQLPPSLPARLAIIGAPLDPALAAEARALADADPRVRYLGPRPHAWTRQAIRRAHVLILPSRMEGGANVVVEAVTAGTAVIASRMSGNVGMLGDDHPGLFPVGDAAALAALVTRACTDRAFLGHLEATGRARAARFTPDAERAALDRVVEAARRSRPVE
jgi:putative glycosyltransferase (TIGR04348 family)